MDEVKAGQGSKQVRGQSGSEVRTGVFFPPVESQLEV